MISSSERRSIEIGREIHEAVVEEGRREGVFAYLYHDGQGRAWFEKYDRRTKEIHRRFSPELAARMRKHVDDLKVYARHCEMDPFTKSNGAGGTTKTRREIAIARCRLIVEAHTPGAPDARPLIEAPAPGIGFAGGGFHAKTVFLAFSRRGGLRHRRAFSLWMVSQRAHGAGVPGERERVG